MSDILSKICDDKRRHIAGRKQLISRAEIEAAAHAAPAPRGFQAALQTALADDRYGLIAEIKKASPSKGLIRADFEPSSLAHAYQAGGASCLSVLTDEPYFQGRDEYLTVAREAVTVPVLRKDFMLDTYQVAEARALGADCILLIMAALDDGQAADLHAAALGFRMDVLIEVHDQDELDRALRLPSGMIGVNNRNLKSLSVDLATTEQLAPHLPQDRLLVSESGLNDPADLARMAAAKCRCFLVGESLMRQADVAAATKRLLSSPDSVRSAR